MFSNKKLKETEQELLAAQSALAEAKRTLEVTSASLFTKEQELGHARVELQRTIELLQSCTAMREELQAKYAPVVAMDQAIAEKNRELESKQQAIVELNEKYKIALSVHNGLEKEIALYEERLDIGSFGLYTPQFDFDTAEQFKQAIDENYEAQKVLIKEDKAIICHTEWTVGGSKSEGKKMTNQYKKLMLFAFNGECDGLIAKVKWNNAEKTKERISKAFDSINKLGVTQSIEITKEYLELKWQELALTYEQEQKKYEEKEEQRRIREQMREEEKAQREFERAQREAEDEEQRYEKALQKAQAELQVAGQANLELLQEKVRLLERQLQEAHERKERAIAMAQLTKVGHIYVISNIGSFGENVYKMGMTRRLDPLDRVRELGDASVPFHFDVHAVIYSENAPQLETELHRQFSDRRLNRVNHKKEFFRVTLDEIEQFVHQHTGAEIMFTKIAEARDYRETMTLLEQLKLPEETKQAESKFPSNLL